MNAVRDARLVVRQLLQTPGYTATIVGVLALAIGANTAIFSAVYAVLLKPSPIRSPEDLVIVRAADPSRSLPVVELSYRMIEHWSDHGDAFSATAAISSSLWPGVLQREGPPVRLASSSVSASLFDTLGVTPLHGRPLLPQDDVPGAAPVAVLSHSTWVTHFGGDSGVIGSTVRFDAARTIVGVMPAAFDFPRGTDLWIPVVPLLSGISRPDFDAMESVGVLFMVGRLAAGSSRGAAGAQLDALAGGAGGIAAPRRFGSEVLLTPFLDYVVGPARDGLRALWVAVGLVLLIACANVAGLMLTRVSTRSREQAIRAALGATPRALARLWLIESGILATAGGLVGIGLGWWMTGAIAALAPSDVPGLPGITITPAVVAFSAGAVLVTIVACGAAPARRATRMPVLQWLKGTPHDGSGARAVGGRSALVIVQMAVSLVLLVSAGLIVRSFTALRNLDAGFTPSNVLTMFVDTRSIDGLPRMLARIRELPDVQAAGAVYLRPLQLGAVGNDTTVVLHGQTPVSARDNPNLNLQVATPGFFEAAGIRLLHGRFFSEEDRAGTQPVTLVGETAARRLWRRADAVGERMLLRNQKEWRIVVGVVADVHYRGLGDVRLDAYEPAQQSSSAAHNLVIRSAGDPLHAAAAVQTAVRQIDPAAIVDSITTLDAIVARAVAPWRFTSWLLGILAGMAFLITTVGLFTTVALGVAARRRELAVRIALGARGSDVLRSVLAPAMAQGAIGLSVGAAVAAFASHALAALLFGVPPLDPVTWAAALGALGATAALAAYLPARRATTIHPAILLRQVE
ncbi:MAG: ABC transporter permease [Acidobacteria bacterium]|nr:ABC transporter permease [Acidobacteriota bacterium]